MSNIITVKNLRKYFHTPKGLLHAVDDVSFSIETGKTLGIVGESGCGKSTTGRAILQLHKPTSGEIIFDGINISSLSHKQMRQMRCNMQIIFQDPFASLNPRMTVSEIIGEPLKIHNKVKSKKELTIKIKELMDMVGLAERLINIYPHELDGGRRQRIGIARALSLNPRFIICDEPVSALDVSIQAQILNLMQDLQEQLGLTYIFITHDLSVVKHFSNDILVMYVGKMAEQAPAEQLFLDPLHPYTKALLSAIPVPHLHQKVKRILLKGEISSPINPKPGCRFATRCPIATEKCFHEDPIWREIKPQHFVACHNV